MYKRIRNRFSQDDFAIYFDPGVCFKLPLICSSAEVNPGEVLS